MEIIVEPNNGEKVIKKLYQQKAPVNGLILGVIQKKDVKIRGCARDTKRFLQCCFNNQGNLFACRSNTGDIYVVDLFLNTYWFLGNAESPTLIKFSRSKENELYVANKCGEINVINVNGGNVIASLIGHRNPIKFISFSSEFYCVTTSDSEGIIWDLRDNTKVQILNLNKGFNLNFLMFLPLTNHILSCLYNDTMQIWQNGSWKYLSSINLEGWKNHSIKNVVFTNNGLTAVMAGYLPNFILYSLTFQKVTKTITLPEYILSVKKIKMAPSNFEWKCNKTLVILSGQGVVYFYDLEFEKVTGKLVGDCEIVEFSLSPKSYCMTVILSTGTIFLYNISQYIESEKSAQCACPKDVKKRKINPKPCGINIANVQSEICSLLPMDKLKLILREYGEYPKHHRLIIWEHILQLPNNSKQYNNIINHITLVSFPELNKTYPLISEQNLKNLRILLNNLVTWCPFFANVTYLPVFVFPFQRVFQNKPMQCFETAATIILNWCQHWFEYYPLPPINVLSIVENLLFEHDLELLTHISSHKIKANLYVWPLLETAFSEVLTEKEWTQFWDHVITNETSFLLCAAASYNIAQRSSILTLTAEDEFTFFYHNQNAVDVKKLISKTYWILDKTCVKLHPRQYFDDFRGIKTDGYPVFNDYPKTVVEFEASHMNVIGKELKESKCFEEMIVKEKIKEWQNLVEYEKKDIENERREAMEKACMERVLQEQEKVNVQHRKLDNLRRSLMAEEKNIMDYSLGKLKSINDKEQTRKMEFLMGNIQLGEIAGKRKFNQAEQELLCRYSDILKHKYTIAEMFLNDPLPSTNVESIVLQEHQRELGRDVDKFRKRMQNKEDLETLNLTTGLLTIEQTIRKVEDELVDELTQKYKNCDPRADKRLLQLEAETKDLEKDIKQLLRTVKKSDSSENKQRRKKKIRSIEDVVASREAGLTLRSKRLVDGEECNIIFSRNK
ncbi:unnamed protein product [Brassicogethes aeneus]|uniref:TBC1 domain family member 31 n=1 Tax=Brassicogethes aeneus TaxID=1431903 RepID=A0A9P0ARZ6_BRAAE|nr:unnamed protein product [Brassicogethes aeneus]